MRIYLTPNDGSGRVVVCQTYEAVHLAIQAFKDEGVSDISSTRGDLVCDFCSHPEIVAMYQIRPGGVYLSAFTSQGNEQHIDSDGRWGACSECQRLISNGDWPELGLRSFTIYKGDAEPEAFDQLMKMSIQAAHGVFRQSWDGSEPKRVQSDAEFLAQHGIGE